MQKSIMRQLVVSLVILLCAGLVCGVVAQNKKPAGKGLADVPRDSWVFPALAVLQRDDLLPGYPPGSNLGRGPNAPMTRFEVTVPIKRTLEALQGGKLSPQQFNLEDLSSINSLFTEFSEELKALGLDTDRTKVRLMSLTQIVASQQNLPLVNPKLIRSDNAFGFHLFGELLKQDTNKNVFFSPASIALALDMTYNGANGSTKAAMEQALHMQGVSLEELNRANATLLSSLKKPDSAVQIDIANGLWISKEGQGVPVKPDFIQRNQDNYHAEIGDLAGAPDNVNAWVSKQTGGKIPTIIQKSDLVNIVAILVNAVYFKGSWAQKFDPTKTAEAPFTDGKGEQASVKMMSQSGDYDYYRGDHFQMVRLPYGSGRLSMDLLLPDVGTPLSTLQTDLTADHWDRWTSSLNKRHGDIKIPRLELRYEADLKEPLTALGMGEAFTSQADFSGIASSVWIGKVRHKTYLAVNEEGTEAAAATGVAVRTKSAILGFRFTADHPFVCAIRDNKTGAVLFLGIINDAKAQ